MADYNIYSDEELLQSLVDLYEEEGEINTELYQEKGEHDPNTIHRRFGSWNKGLQEAGLSTAISDNIYGDEELLQSLIDLYEEEGEININVYNDKGDHDAETIRRRFGSWNQGLEEAGLPLARPNRCSPKVSDHDIIESVNQIKNMYDLDSMSMSSYKIFRDKYLTDENIILPSINAINRRFGSYADLLNICNLRGERVSVSRRGMNITESDVVEYTVKHFGSLFPGEVTTEHVIRDDSNNYIGRADVAVEDRMVVIECKDTRTTNIRGGVGQAVYYNTAGYGAYLSLYDECIRDNDISVCNDVGIGLIGVTPDDLNVYVESDIEIDGL